MVQFFLIYAVYLGGLRMQADVFLAATQETSNFNFLFSIYGVFSTTIENPVQFFTLLCALKKWQD